MGCNRKHYGGRYRRMRNPDYRFIRSRLGSTASNDSSDAAAAHAGLSSHTVFAKKQLPRDDAVNSAQLSSLRF